MGRIAFSRIWPALVVVAVLFVTALHRAGWDAASIAGILPLRCPLYLLTGIECPTCGLGRGVVSALVGNWRAASAFHPLSIPVAAAAVIGAACRMLVPMAKSIR